MRRVETPDDPELALFTGVRDPELLARHGLFVAESRLVIERALSHPLLRCRALLLTEAASEALEPPAALPLLIAAPGVLEALTGFHLHQGALGLFERPPPLSPSAVISHADGRPIVFLARVTDPDNVGAIFRSAAALGAGGVLLGAGTADPLYRKAIRTSMGATLSLPYARAESFAELRAMDYAIAALTPSGRMALRDWRPAPRQALVLGNEGDGLPEEICSGADAVVRIPIRGDSLNVSAAAAIALHHLTAP